MAVTAYTDGACRGGNPGFTSCAWVMYDSAEPGQEVAEAKYLGPDRHTNNYAEYQGLIMLLEFLYKAKLRNVFIYSDSELVVNQTLGHWDINKDDLKKYAAKCYGLLVQGCHVLQHVKGHDGSVGNERADELCNLMLEAHKGDYEKQT